MNSCFTFILWMARYNKIMFFCFLFFLCEKAGTGIIILAQVWVTAFQESLRLTMTQIPSLNILGSIIRTKNANCLFPLPQPSFLSIIKQRAGRLFCVFHWIIYMCHHRRSSVRSAEGGGRHRKNVERLSVHKDIDKWLREEESGVESCWMVRRSWTERVGKYRNKKKGR